MPRRLVLAVALAAALLSCRGAKPLDEIDRLYLEAVMAPGGQAGQDAVRELAARSEPQVEDMLVRLAVQQSAARNDRVAQEAVRQLMRREARDAVPALTALLAPDRSARIRKAAADAFLVLGCPRVCVEAALEYLFREYEREDSGWLTARLAREDASEALEYSIRRAFDRTEAKVRETLFKSLRANGEETVEALAADYGLGGDQPSSFVLDLVFELQLREACAALVGVEGAEAARAAAECGK